MKQQTVEVPLAKQQELLIYTGIMTVPLFLDLMKLPLEGCLYQSEHSDNTQRS